MCSKPLKLLLSHPKSPPRWGRYLSILCSISTYLHIFKCGLATLSVPSPTHGVKSRTICIRFDRTIHLGRCIHLKVESHLVKEIDRLFTVNECPWIVEGFKYRSCVPSMTIYLKPSEMTSKRCCAQDGIWSLLDFQIR